MAYLVPRDALGRVCGPGSIIRIVKGQLQPPKRRRRPIEHDKDDVSLLRVK